MKSFNGKSMAAMAVVAVMMFGAVGIVIADGADAAPAPVRDPVEYGYDVDEGDLFAIMDFDLAMFLGKAPVVGDIYTAAEGETPAKGFVVDVYQRYAPEAKILVEFEYDLNGIDSIDMILPAYLMAYVDEEMEKISVPLTKASDAQLVLTIAGFGGDKVAFDFATTDIYVKVLVGEDANLYTEEELEAAVEAATDALKAEVAALSADIKAKDIKIADLEKQLEDAKKASKGDDTVAWCVAALGIIAAGVLAGFTVLAATKAKKEGRRFI